MGAFKWKKLFFRRDMIGKYLDRKTYYVLNKFGGLVRKTAQRSMRAKKGKSAKGTPPYAHGKKLLRKLLFYSMEKKKKTVIVGPVLLSKTAKIGVPSLQEEGGTIAVKLKRVDKIVTKQYPPRPFMKPSFDIHIGKVAAMYKEASRKK